MKYIFRSRLTWNRKCILCLLPSLIGVGIFYLIPFFRVVFYSLINNQFQRKFIGFHNYIEILQNEFFILALKNSILLIVFCVPVLIILAIVISLVLSFLIKYIKGIRVAFILPMLIPTASITVIWKMIFHNTTNVMPIYILFIWKNIGICIILLTAAFTTIDKSILESARLDGASGYMLHTRVTIPIIAPTCFFAILLSIVNSFRIYKESYLYYGNQYPPDYSYTLQYYMNNNFLKFDYQALAVSSVLTSILVLAIILVGFWIQRRCSFDSYR